MSLTTKEIERLTADLIKSITRSEHVSNRQINTTLRKLQNHRFLDTDGFKVHEKFHGLIEKIWISGGDEASHYTSNELRNRIERLSKNYDSLNLGAISDYDINGERIDIKRDLIDHTLSLLIELSDNAVEHAQEYYRKNTDVERREQESTKLTWNDIIREDSLSGDHWKTPYNDYSFEEKELIEEIQLIEDSEWNFERVAKNQKEDDELQRKAEEKEKQEKNAGQASIEWRVRQILNPVDSNTCRIQEIKLQQYWNSSFESLSLPTIFDINNANSLATGLRVVAGMQASNTPLIQNDQTIFVAESNIISEIFFMITVSTTCMECTPLFQVDEDAIYVKEHRFALRHSSRGSLNQILRQCAKLGTILLLIRKFSTRLCSEQFGPTASAFGQAIGGMLEMTNSEFASLENRMQNSNFISLIDVLKKVELHLDPYVTFHNSVLSNCHLNTGITHKNALHILSLLFKAVLNAETIRDTSPRNERYYQFIVQLFRKSLRPMWDQMDEWTCWGRKVEREFFIIGRDASDIETYVPEIWPGADWHLIFQIIKDEGNYAVPPFLFYGQLVEKILDTGKIVNILSRLGALNEIYLNKDYVSINVGEKSGFELSESECPLYALDDKFTGNVPNMKIPDPPFERVLQDLLSKHFMPRYRETSIRFKEYLIQSCGLWREFISISGIFLGQQGYELDLFCRELFDRFNAGSKWYDQHVISSVLHNSMENSKWLDLSLVTIKVVDVKLMKSYLRTIKAISHLSIDYQVNWPASIIFSMAAITCLQRVFSYILQLKLAKYSLERLSLIKAGDTQQTIRWSPTSSERILFYSMRLRLMWFVNVIWSYTMMTIVHPGYEIMKQGLEKSNDIAEMLEIFMTQAEAIKDHCLLSSNTEALHVNILAILEMTITFADSFTAYSGETSFINGSSSSGGFDAFQRRRRRRRHRRPRKKLVKHDDGQVTIARIEDVEGNEIEEEESIGSSEDDDEEYFDADNSMTLNSSAYISFVEESFLERLENMQRDFESRVTFIRDIVDGLSKTSGYWWFEVLATNLTA